MASCRPASGLGGRTTLLPNADVRTLHASGAFGVNVPSGCRYPGSSEVGIGRGSVNGLKMKGLVGKTSMAVRPVSMSISCGVWSTKPPQLWAHARLPGTAIAAPHIRLSLMSSRRLSLVISGLFISPPTISCKNFELVLLQHSVDCFFSTTKQMDSGSGNAGWALKSLRRRPPELRSCCRYRLGYLRWEQTTVGGQMAPAACAHGRL
jgi:hypothetical protein